jgi:large subunit ribosomal protein L18
MSKELKIKRDRRERRKNRTRKVLKGTMIVPRFCVVKTNKYVYCQFIDDLNSRTLLGIHSKEISKDIANVAISEKLGELAGKKAMENKISRVIFDRGASRYTGKVKAVAEGARKSGLRF